MGAHLECGAAAHCITRQQVKSAIIAHAWTCQLSKHLFAERTRESAAPEPPRSCAAYLGLRRESVAASAGCAPTKSNQRTRLRAPSCRFTLPHIGVASRVPHAATSAIVSAWPDHERAQREREACRGGRRLECGARDEAGGDKVEPLVDLAGVQRRGAIEGGGGGRGAAGEVLEHERHALEHVAARGAKMTEADGTERFSLIAQNACGRVQ